MFSLVEIVMSSTSNTENKEKESMVKEGKMKEVNGRGQKKRGDEGREWWREENMSSK